METTLDRLDKATARAFGECVNSLRDYASSISGLCDGLETKFEQGQTQTQTPFNLRMLAEVMSGVDALGNLHRDLVRHL